MTDSDSVRMAQWTADSGEDPVQTHLVGDGCWPEHQERPPRNVPLDDNPVPFIDPQPVIDELLSLRQERDTWRATQEECHELHQEAEADRDNWKLSSDLYHADVERLTGEVKTARQERADAINHANQIRPDDWKQQRTHLVSERDRLTAELDAANHEHQSHHGYCSATPALCSHDAEITYLKTLAKVQDKQLRVLTATARKAVTSLGDVYHETAIRYLAGLVGLGPDVRTVPATVNTEVVELERLVLATAENAAEEVERLTAELKNAQATIKLLTDGVALLEPWQAIAEQRAAEGDRLRKLLDGNNQAAAKEIARLQALVEAQSRVVQVARHVENSNSQIPGGTELSYISTYLIEELGTVLKALDQATTPPTPRGKPTPIDEHGHVLSADAVRQWEELQVERTDQATQEDRKA